MGIISRITTLFKADIHGIMDEMQDDEVLIKHCLREMEEEIGRKESKYNKMKISFTHSHQLYEKLKDDIEQLDADLDAALRKDRDDIARFIIKKHKNVSAYQRLLNDHNNRLKQDMDQLQECIETQRREYEKLRIKAMDFCQRLDDERWPQSISALKNCRMTDPLSDEEIELELLRRKEAIMGGTVQ